MVNFYSSLIVKESYIYIYIYAEKIVTSVASKRKSCFLNNVKRNFVVALTF